MECVNGIPIFLRENPLGIALEFLGTEIFNVRGLIPGRKPQLRVENPPRCSVPECKNIVAKTNSNGKAYWRKYCHFHADARYKRKRNLIQKISGELMACQWSGCTFKIENGCQLDVDHIDGNRNNNDKSNLQILCANHHRVKTKLNGDNGNRYKN